jgi:Flp pilus assembly pilin Flp
VCPLLSIIRITNNRAARPRRTDKGVLSSVAKQMSTFDLGEFGHAAVARSSEERGQTMTEYAVVLTMITLAVILAVAALSNSVASHITRLVGLF